MSKARDIADLDFNSPDIDGGNIDGATIGATTAAAGTFSNVNVGGQNILNDNYDAVGAIFRRNGSHGAVISLGRQGVGDGVTLDYPSDNTFAVSTAGVERFQISSGGAATFNAGASFAGNTVHYGNGNAALDWGNTSTVGQLSFDGTTAIVRSSVANADMVFQGNDGGSFITALRFDMSEAGYATFNDGISAKRHLVQTAGEIEFDFNGIGEHFTGGNSPHIFAGQGSSSTYLAGTLNFQSRQTVARDINFITGTTPQVALNLNGSTGAGTFADDVIADAFLPTTAGAYGSNHVGVHNSGVVLNAATGQTGYIMSAGSGAMTFGPTGATIQLGGFTTANKLDDYEEGTWTPNLQRTSGGNISAVYSTPPTGTYTKIGRLVHITIIAGITSVSSQGSGYAYLTGLPFAYHGNSYEQYLPMTTNTFGSNVMTAFYPSSTAGYFGTGISSTNFPPLQVSWTAGTLRISGVYKTN